MTVGWYCAQTKLGQTLVARDHLQRMAELRTIAGLAVCFPIYTTRRVVRHLVRERSYPLFPGYMLVAFDIEIEGWQKINGVRGVKRLICGVGEETPTRIPLVIMNDLLARVADGPIYDYSKLEIFKRGQQLRVKEGSFEGFVGPCIMSSRQRVEVLLTMFNRKTPVRLLPNQVELAS